VNGFWKNPIIAFLSSLKLSAVLMVLVAVASAKGTFLENDYGRDGAYDLVYDARWFEALLAMVTVSLILLFFKRWPYRLKQSGFALLHLSIVVILISSGITRYFGYEGVMSIREGQSVDYMFTDKSHIKAGLGQDTASFPVRLWKYGTNDIWHKVTLGGQDYDLGVTEYWPYFGTKWEEGPGGVPAIQFGHTHDGNVHTENLKQGEKTSFHGVETRFLTGDFMGGVSASTYGDLRVHIDGTSCTIPVEPGSDSATDCGGFKFRITEFQTDFKVGGGTSTAGPMVNPMIRVEVTDPAGETGERILFAFHPDFSMGHGGGEDAFADLDILYSYSQGIEFSAGGSTGVRGRASFDLQTLDMNSQEEGDIPAGTVFDVTEEVIYAGVDNDFSLVPVKVMASVIEVPGLSDNENARAAARVEIRNRSGESAELIVLEHDRGKPVTLGGESFTLSYGPAVIPLDYSVHLDDFVLQTYPGSQNPATYESWVTVTDPARGVQGEKVHIFMNNPMNHAGSKHFQSSYDQDLGGTVLTVNHDPGKLPTYFGYFLISLGFILIILKDLLFKDRSKKAATTAIVALAALTMAGGSFAQTHDPNDGQDHSGHNHAQPEAEAEHNHAPASGYVTLSDPARKAAERLIIQDYRGRMKPLDTLARETVMKIAKRSKYEGREPVDQYLSWSLNPYFWSDKPVIGVRYPGLKDLLGIDHSIKNVSYSSLITQDGQYSLSAQVSEAHRTSDRDRTKVQRKLISFDERFQMLNMVFQGMGLKMYPIPNDANDTWGTFQEVTRSLDPTQAGEYSAASTAFDQGIQSGNNAQIMDAVTRLGSIQAKYGANVLPSDTVINAELFYNKSHIFSWMMIPLLGTFLVLMPVYLWNLFRNAGARLSFRNPFYSLGMALFFIAFGGMILGYAVRWIASERIPISNGHESLLFISLAVAMAGLIFDMVYRMAAPAALGGLLTTVVLGVSMLATFDPAIGPLVPVLVSYWLNIHVTIITSSYGFLGLAALIGALVLFLLMIKGPGKENVRDAVKTLDNVNKYVVITGLGLLTVGTLLGGVWANESWGRYWGWDPKETWSLITILVYSIVLHFRWIPALRSIWLNASISMAAIASVVMTYFGVNYFLSGLHSYASGDAAQVPNWVYLFTAGAVVLIAVSGVIDRKKSW